jgi:hypothetical protein
VDWKTMVAAVVPASITAIGSACVLIRTKRIDADTHRADRDQERRLDYEQRVWQAKSDILKTLISACRSVKRQAQQHQDEKLSRATTIRALDLFRDKIGEDGISEITAYAAEPVREAVDELLELINTQLRAYSDPLLTLRTVGNELRQLGDEIAAASGESHANVAPGRLETAPQRASLYFQRIEALNIIGGTSDLDVDGVVALCDRVIDVARNDLRGEYGVPKPAA